MSNNESNKLFPASIICGSPVVKLSNIFGTISLTLCKAIFVNDNTLSITDLISPEPLIVILVATAGTFTVTFIASVVFTNVLGINIIFVLLIKQIICGANNACTILSGNHF